MFPLTADGARDARAFPAALVRREPLPHQREGTRGDLRAAGGGRAPLGPRTTPLSLPPWTVESLERAHPNGVGHTHPVLKRNVLSRCAHREGEDTLGGVHPSGFRLWGVPETPLRVSSLRGIFHRGMTAPSSRVTRVPGTTAGPLAGVSLGQRRGAGRAGGGGPGGG
jgi:hypothetical protein